MPSCDLISLHLVGRVDRSSLSIFCLCRPGVCFDHSSVSVGSGRGRVGGCGAAIIYFYMGPACV